MEDSISSATQAPTPITTQTKEKMSKKQVIGMTVLSVIAIAGVVFGIFGMTDSNQKNQEIEKLKIQVTEATTGQKTELETEQITITDPDGTTTEITDTINAVNPADYIYVGEWGIKIKTPETLLGKIGYLVGGDYLEIVDTTEINTYESVIDWNNNNVLKIARTKTGTINFEECIVSCSTYITTINGYDYSYMLTGSNTELLEKTPLKEMANKDSISEI